jgi:hypothetical protein
MRERDTILPQRRGADTEAGLGDTAASLPLPRQQTCAAVPERQALGFVCCGFVRTCLAVHVALAAANYETGVV